MRCPTCGFAIDHQQLDRCPNCGTALRSPAPAWYSPPPGDAPAVPGGTAQADYTAPSSGEPPQSPVSPVSPAGPQMPPQYYPYPPYAAPNSTPYTPPAEATPPAGPESPYGAPPNASPSNPYGGYGGYAPPSGYGQYGGYAPPSGYGQPYGQPQPYSQPLPGGYPIAPGYAPGYALPRLAPLPERKRHTGRIVAIVALVVVVLAACTGGTIFAIRSITPSASLQPTPPSGLLTPTASTPTAANSSTANVSGTVIYQNTFASDAASWLEDPGKCFYASDGYHSANGWACFAPIGTQTDVDVIVTAQQVSGPTTFPYGIVFRYLDGLTSDSPNNYQFVIDSNGKWVFFKVANGTVSRLVNYTPNNAIHGGLHTANTLELRAKGAHFDFFVNGTKVGSFDDSTIPIGHVGVVAGDNVDAVFTNLTITRPD